MNKVYTCHFFIGIASGTEYSKRTVIQWLFFAEANWRMLQNELNGKNCKTALGATPPNPCKIGHFITLKGNVINYPILAFFSKSGLQYSPFYFCNKQVVAFRSWLYARRIDNGCQTEEFPRSLHL